MNQEVKLTLNSLDAKIARLISVGTIDKGSHQPDKLIVKIGQITTKPLPFLTQRAGEDSTWWRPDFGEQVLVLCPSGDYNQGIILPAIYQNQFPAASTNPEVQAVNFSDGAYMEYDKSAHHLKIILPAGAKTTLISDGGVTIEGDVMLMGNLLVTQNLNVTGFSDTGITQLTVT